MSHIAVIGPALAGNSSPAFRHVPALAHHKICFLHDYWAHKHTLSGELPTRRDIDPVEFPDLLPNVFLLNVLDQAPWFTYRVAGAKVSWAQRTLLTGKALGENMPEAARGPALDWTRSVVAAGRPAYRAGDLSTLGRDYLNYEELILPLGGPGGRVTMLFGILVVTDPAGKEC